MNDVLVRTRGLVKHYADAGRLVRVLEGVDFSLPPGARIAIVGESGVGKSTLLHLLGALDRPTSGSIEFDGEELTSMSPRALAEFRNREIGFVFQFHHLLPDFSAEENVMMPALIGGAGHESARRQARAILERVGLAERLDHKPGELSGGEQQRVSVARAIVCSPRLLLADEPTGNLDPATGDDLQRLLVGLNEEGRMALLVVTHSERLASAMDSVFRLQDGQMVAERT